jgi:hypothetical protein
MPRFYFDKTINKRDVVFVTIIAVTLIIVVGMLGHHGVNKPAAPIHHSMTPTIVVPSSAPEVHEPALASVAAAVGCVKFVDLGPAPTGNVLDHGNCWVGSKKYGIDSFASNQIRDAWVTSTRGLGVIPQWETDKVVIYPSAA